MSREFTEFMNGNVVMTFKRYELDMIRKLLSNRGHDYEEDGNADMGEPYFEISARIEKELIFDE